MLISLQEYFPREFKKEELERLKKFVEEVEKFVEEHN